MEEEEEALRDEQAEVRQTARNVRMLRGEDDSPYKPVDSPPGENRPGFGFFTWGSKERPVET